MSRVLAKPAETQTTNQVSVTTTATEIVPANNARKAVLIVNHGTTDVYIGTSGVTTTNGVLLTGTKGTHLSIPGTMAVYGIVGAGSQTVSYIEIAF